MFVVRGRPADATRDGRVGRAMLERAGRTREAGVRAWRPHPQVAFGPRDVRHEGHPAAARAARAAGLEPTERRVGGHPVALTGTTVACTWVVPIEDARRGLRARYGTVAKRLRGALADLGVEATSGEPPNSFCPGQHSLSAVGKVVGLAQRVTADAAAVSGVVVTADHERIGAVLAEVYPALGLAFDPDSVGSIERAGGEADPSAVEAAVEAHLLDGAPVGAVEAEALLAESAP
ncbi:MAG: lipoyl protein ligase domain-containing protein [Halobacteriales archaeon]